MNQLVDLGPWRLECDPDATRAAYAKIEAGGPEECSCDGCRNWIELREEIYTPGLRDLLGSLGITPEKEVEIYHMAPLADGLHAYGGWWHCVGRIETDADGLWSPPGATLGLMIFEKSDLAAPAFEGQPVLQLEFYAEMRWATDKPEPHV